jgi:hypothetical protein
MKHGSYDLDTAADKKRRLQYKSYKIGIDTAKDFASLPQMPDFNQYLRLGKAGEVYDKTIPTSWEIFS